MLAFAVFAGGSVSAQTFSMWEDEDEESRMNGGAVEPRRDRPSKGSARPPREAPRPSLAIESGILGGYSTRNSGGYVAPSAYSPTVVPNQMTGNNNDVYSMVDYDIMQSEREVGDSEILNSIDKWQLGVKNVYWENYRGNNVRIEMLRNNRDMKEMRLKFVQSQNMISDPDGSISDMLNNVADKVMKSTCGRKARQAIVLYERPSVELVKETTYDNYKIIAKGTSLKEYGFRCIY
jgi:hypothetical protein